MAPMAPPLSIFLFPLMAPGHMNPMAGLANLLSNGGAKVTILTTPSNAPSLQPMIDHSNINLLLLHFPSSESSDGRHENLTSLPTPQITQHFFTALEHLCHHSLDQALRHHLPDCIIFDSFIPWTPDIAARHGVRSLVFHTVGFFPLCVSHSLRRHKPIIGNDPGDTILVLDLPHRVEMRVSQLPNSVRAVTPFNEFSDRMVEAELKSHGAVVNSFYEVEPSYIDHYHNGIGRKAWHVGPLSLSLSSVSTGESGRVLGWLDAKPTDSVIYICFGSLSRPTPTQMREIRVGLERSARPFIWVVRDDEDDDGFDEVGEGEQAKGMVIKGWAPQREILNHRAVGGFVTHLLEPRRGNDAHAALEDHDQYTRFGASELVLFSGSIPLIK